MISLDFTNLAPRPGDAHLAGQHPGVSVNPALLHLSYWHTICDWTGTTA